MMVSAMAPTSTRQPQANGRDSCLPYPMMSVEEMERDYATLPRTHISWHPDETRRRQGLPVLSRNYSDDEL